MADKQQLAPGSAEFGRLEYFLQLSLKASTARILALLNDELAYFAHFLRHGQTTQPQSNEEELVKKGVQLSESEPGLRVYHGALPKGGTQSSSKHSGASQPIKHSRRIVLCKVVIGHALATRNESTAAQEVMPEGYDSFYLMESSNPDTYQHQYFVKSGAQILPQYILQFEFDPEKERRSRDKARCDNCEVSVATVFCQADAANLCRNCDEKLHTANKLASRHIRTPIGKGVDVYGTCRIHQDKMVEFFCSECHVPVCVYCKMVGHHSQGDNAKHKLISVTEAYEAVSREIQQPDNSLVNRRDVIQSQAGEISARVKAVEDTEQQLRQQIDDIYRRACADLDAVMKRKMATLQGDECELRRQLGEISRLEDFVDYQQGGGDATAFLFNWARHAQLKEELHKVKPVEFTPQEAMDIKCNGSINIITNNTVPLPKRASSASPNKPFSNRFTPSPTKQSPITVGITNRLAERKNTQMRKTSEYFAEALNALDDYPSSDLGKEGYSTYSNSVYGVVEE